MKRMTFFVMALAMVLGLIQCKKEQPVMPQQEGVTITLNVDNGNNKGSKANVNPPHVTFIKHDTILVASDGKYVGYLVHNGTTFSGTITAPTVGEPLYFYFLGNKIKVSTLNADDTECTVNISDQTNYPHLPVISMAPSTVNYSSEVSSYSARLHNHCSLMRFNVTTDSEAAICITGMNNTVTVDFGAPTAEGNGFSYDMDGEGIIKMAGGNTAERWIVVLQQNALNEGEIGSVYSIDGNCFGSRPALDAINIGQSFNAGVDMTVNSPAWDGDLSKLTAGVSERYATATDGMTISGTLAADVKVSIADGASVTLDGANINNNSKSGSVNCAGLTCLGNATLHLKGGSIINCASAGYPGIQAGPSGKTLTIQNSDQGTGTLNVQGGSNAAGIGGGNGISCGNISLMGGTINACGGQNGAGIGSAQNSSCGNIEIEGGEITAQGGDGAAGIGSGSSEGGIINAGCGGIFLYGGTINACGGDGAAGIGSGKNSSCGNIEVEGGEITAIGGDGAAGIGSGQFGSCGDIEVQGGEVSATGNGGGSDIGEGYGGSCESVTLPPPEGALRGLFSVSSSKQVRFSQGNLLKGGTFAANQYSYGDHFASNYIYSGPTSDWYTLSSDEWSYLCEHSTLGFATVNGIHGLIILPNYY